ncbi:hypothetical protein ACQ4PT_054566 [Festuca glaucescens]
MAARVCVTRKSIVKASVTRPSTIVAVSNLDLLRQGVPIVLFCAYPSTAGGSYGFHEVAAAFEAKLPSLLDHFFPLAGRIVADPRSGLSELHCYNQGAELVVGEVAVALGSLDYGDLDASLARIGVPVQYGADVVLSLQLVSFTCGGFAVAWGSHHVAMDGCALSMIANAWSELSRSGTIAAAPNLDRSVFRPRAPPTYSSSVGKLFMPLERERLVNALTASISKVGRTYYVEEEDLDMLRAQAGGRATLLEAVCAYMWKVFAAVVGSSDEKCRMGWWVDGRRRRRRRLTAAAPTAMRNYIGNVITFAVAEASVEGIRRLPLPGVASMVRESIKSAVNDEHFQELVDWVEEHKGAAKYVETAIVGVGSPVLSVSSLASFRLDTDFGFGQATLVTWLDEMEVEMEKEKEMDWGRLSSGFVKIVARPGGSCWFFGMSIWPSLAAALDSDEQHIFKPLTAEYLGLVAGAKNSKASRL